MLICVIFVGCYTTKTDLRGHRSNYDSQQTTVGRRHSQRNSTNTGNTPPILAIGKLTPFTINQLTFMVPFKEETKTDYVIQKPRI